MCLVIDARYLGPRSSGIGTYIKALVCRLPVLAPDLPIRLWVDRETSFPGAAERGIHLHRVAPVANSLMTLAGPWALDRLTARDLFHAPANILGYGMPCPSIVTVHDVMWLERPADCQPSPWLRPISQTYYHIGIRRALRRARRILTVSNASARAIQQIEPSVDGKIVVTHNAHEAHFQLPSCPCGARTKAARILGFENDYLLVVGQDQPTKGHEIAIRAFARARPYGIHLVLIQRLSRGNRLINLAFELGLRDRVRFVSEIKLDEFLAVVQSARALLHPSYAEGFGLPVLEAAACGCPVVASAIPALNEVLEDAALYAPAGNISAWSDAIERVISDAILAESLKLKGLERACWFSWDRTARATLNAYREVLAEMS